MIILIICLVRLTVFVLIITFTYTELLEVSIWTVETHTHPLTGATRGMPGTGGAPVPSENGKTTVGASRP